MDRKEDPSERNGLLKNNNRLELDLSGSVSVDYHANEWCCPDPCVAFSFQHPNLRVIWYFLSATINILAVIGGAAADVGTIIAYAHSGDADWAILSSVFVAVGWILQAFVVLSADFRSTLFKSKFSARRWLFALLYMGGSAMDWDKVAVGLYGWRRDGATGVFAVQAQEHTPTRAQAPTHSHASRAHHHKNDANFFKSHVTAFKAFPNAMLQGYALFFCQFSADFLGKRFSQLEVAVQICSLVFGLHAVSQSIVTALHRDADTGNHTTGPGVMSLSSITTYFSSLALSCAVVLSTAVFVCALHSFMFLTYGVAIVLAGSAMCVFEAIGASARRQRFMIIFLAVVSCVCVVGTVLALFVFVRGGSVEVAGMCSHSTDVDHTGDCYPRAVVYGIVAVHAVNTVCDL